MLERKQMFRQQALEQLSSPEQLETLLRVTNRRTWITIVTIGALSFAIVLWSIFGQIPVTVSGAGILVHPRQVISFQAPANGQLVSLDLAVGDRVREGQVIGTINQPDIAQQLEQERVRLSEALARDERVSVVGEKRRELERDAIERKRELIKGRIDVIRRIAEAQKVRNEGYFKQQDANVAQMQQVLRTLGKALDERYRSYKRLRSEGLSSEDQVLQSRQAVIDNQLRSSDLDLRVQEIELQRIEANDGYQRQLDRIAELETEYQELDIRLTELRQSELETKSNTEISIEEIRRNIARLKNDLDTRGRIVSKYNGRVIELAAGLGQVVRTGQSLGAIEAEVPDGKLVGVAYFEIGDGKKVQDGMEIRITPATVKRERYGSIKGAVVDVSSYPVTSAGVTSVVGNAEVAKEITSGRSKIQVYADLHTDPDTPTGFLWTSGEGPEGAITPGTTTMVRVTVEKRRPISFLIPLLKGLSGAG